MKLVDINDIKELYECKSALKSQAPKQPEAQYSIANIFKIVSNTKKESHFLITAPEEKAFLNANALLQEAKVEEYWTPLCNIK